MASFKAASRGWNLIMEILVDAVKSNPGELNPLKGPPHLIHMSVSFVFCPIGKRLRTFQEDRKGKFCHRMEGT